MRLVSLLITLLVMAFIITQLIGGSGSHNKAEENNAKIAEEKAESVQATILKSAQVQDRSLNNAEGGAYHADGNTPGATNLNQQVQQLQGMPQQPAQQPNNGQQQQQ